jgi:phosphohistidine phosphatase
MHRLLLLRHAKAERSRPGERDHDRRLAVTGRDDAPLIGAYVARHGYQPDHVLVSTAVRTRETWELCAAAMAEKPPVAFEERLYEASPHTLLAIIKETDPGVATLLLIGHNPGLQELATLLIATGDVDVRQRLREAFPTSGLAVIEFALDAWDKLHPQSGRLAHFIEPRSVAAATD